MNKRIIIIFALFSVVHIGNSQNVPNNFVVDLKNMPTPNVAEFNKNAGITSKNGRNDAK